ncbi:MAG: sulfite exporter TauE/SafE family protein [Neisseria sp.]|nr:sulfite exporter TauE/SafE family protein [Neisseria sp.]
MWQWDLIAPLVVAGCIAGFMAGLLGLGGGVLVVSAMVYILHAQFGELAYLQHIAIGTSFAVMIFTGMANALAQHRLHAVRWDMVRRIAPGMVLGTILGSLLAPLIPEKALRIGFIVFVYFLCIKMWRQRILEPTPRDVGKRTLFGAGGGIGLLSSWLGIGGGTISVPFLMYCGLAMRQAVGTSAVLAWPIAVTGALSYLASGWGQADLPPQTVGFIYLPGLLVLSLCTVIFAPLGAKTASAISPKTLKIVFVLLLLVIALDMTRRIFFAA